MQLLSPMFCCIYSIFYELLSLQKPEDVNPRTSFDWTRVPQEYDPCIVQVPATPSVTRFKPHACQVVSP